MAHPEVEPAGANTPDRPIERQGDDKLERSRFIERLSVALIRKQTSRSTGVVVGITGPWGSGKSSILNLLHEHVATKHPSAIIIRFDPWLVSGRNDLIAEFLAEVIGTINSDEQRKAKYQELGLTVAEYGAHFAPAANLFFPGLGALVSGGMNAAKTALGKRGSLTEVRARLKAELRTIASPIVVLIDEIDRIEDDEVRTVAQLVRSIADFPGISYVLAYDSQRVIQALGGGERGKAYLEKIVQLQIPLPVTFADEIARLVTAELEALRKDLNLPENFRRIERYEKLQQILIEDVVETPRDVRRLVGTFEVLASMVQGEVDWIDTLAYSALLIKAPATVARMRRDPDLVLSGSMSSSARAILRTIDREKKTAADRLAEVIADSEHNDGVAGLMEYLFPALSDEPRHEHTDALSERRPLLTILRLGLIPGAYSREEVESLVDGSAEGVSSKLRENYEKGDFGALADRLDDLSDELQIVNKATFWIGAADFLRKPNCEWMTSYQPMTETINSVAELLEGAIRRRPEAREKAAEIFRQLRKADELQLTPRWLRRHVHTYGLYANSERGGDRWFLSREEVEDTIKSVVLNWRERHLSGDFISCLWDLQTVYTMIDAGTWDDRCRQKLHLELEDDRAIDGFTLMLFGGHYTTDRSTVEKICNRDTYLKRARQRLSSNRVHETVSVALRKALGEDF